MAVEMERDGRPARGEDSPRTSSAAAAPGEKDNGVGRYCGSMVEADDGELAARERRGRVRICGLACGEMLRSDSRAGDVGGLDDLDAILVLACPWALVLPVLTVECGRDDAEMRLDRCECDDSNRCCSSSEMREGPGTGGSGVEGGPVGGGLAKPPGLGACVGVGGMCDGGAGKDSRRRGTGARRGRGVAIVVVYKVMVGSKTRPSPAPSLATFLFGKSLFFPLRSHLRFSPACSPSTQPPPMTRSLDSSCPFCPSALPSPPIVASRLSPSPPKTNTWQPRAPAHGPLTAPYTLSILKSSPIGAFMNAPPSTLPFSMPP